MTNSHNLVVLEGYLAAAPTYVNHDADGSKSVFVKLGIRDTFKSKLPAGSTGKRADGTFGVLPEGSLGYNTQWVTCQGYIQGPSAKNYNPEYPNGIYGRMEKGMKVSITGHMASYVVKDGAIAKDGVTRVNRWEQCIRIDGVTIRETQAEKAIRQNNQAQKALAAKNNAQAPVAAQAPAAVAAEAPAYDEGVADFSELGC